MSQLWVRDDRKLLDDGGEIPKSQWRGWGLDFRLWNLLSMWHKLVRWSTASCALPLACQPYVQNNFFLKKKPELWRDFMIYRKVRLTSNCLEYDHFHESYFMFMCHLMHKEIKENSFSCFHAYVVCHFMYPKTP